MLSKRNSLAFTHTIAYRGIIRIALYPQSHIHPFHLELVYIHTYDVMYIYIRICINSAFTHLLFTRWLVMWHNDARSRNERGHSRCYSPSEIQNTKALVSSRTSRIVDHRLPPPPIPYPVPGPRSAAPHPHRAFVSRT